MWELMDQNDLFELSLISDAKTWLEYAKINEEEPNPWDQEGYFEIPAYLRERVEKELKITPECCEAYSFFPKEKDCHDWDCPNPLKEGELPF